MTKQIPVSAVFGFLSSDVQCTSQTISCPGLPGEQSPCKSLLRFDFPSLWNIAQNYYSQCPTGSWLFDTDGIVSSPSLALTNEACEAIAGAHFKVYPAGDIWYRLTTWKFPLFQLVATSPRPALGKVVEAFTISHLLGDPIGSLEDLLRKTDECQRRAIFWQIQLECNDILPSSDQLTTDKERMWKAFAIITDSYGEWGSEVGKTATKGLKSKLESLSKPDVSAQDRENFVKACLTTAGALAADRSTQLLPVIVAQTFFIGQIAVAMIKTKSSAEREDPSTYINIEMYSIGFTALYFWLITAVIMTSVIGASQTAEAIPRILNRFARDLEQAQCATELPTETELESGKRIGKGGVYSWQPYKSKSDDIFPAFQNAQYEINNYESLPSQYRLRILYLKVWPFLYVFLPFSVFAAAILTGMGVSFAVPPTGWSCRSFGEAIIALIWLASYLGSLVGRLLPEMLQFGFTFVKDILSVAGTTAWIIAIQVGIYNKCACYTKSGQVGLALPEQGDANSILRRGLQVGGSYTIIVTFGVLFQLVIIPSILFWRYRAAVRVYMQRDDGTSNLQIWRGRREERTPEGSRSANLQDPAQELADMSKSTSKTPLLSA